MRPAGGACRRGCCASEPRRKRPARASPAAGTLRGPPPFGPTRLGRRCVRELNPDANDLARVAVGEPAEKGAEKTPFAARLLRADHLARDDAAPPRPVHPTRIRRVRVPDPPPAALCAERAERSPAHGLEEGPVEVAPWALDDLESDHPWGPSRPRSPTPRRRRARTAPARAGAPAASPPAAYHRTVPGSAERPRFFNRGRARLARLPGMPGLAPARVTGATAMRSKAGLAGNAPRGGGPASAAPTVLRSPGRRRPPSTHRSPSSFFSFSVAGSSNGDSAGWAGERRISSARIWDHSFVCPRARMTPSAPIT